MSGDLRLLNRQRTRPVDLRLLRRMLNHVLATSLAEREFDLTIHLVNAAEMTRLNETHLQHAGPTDVITLDYSAAAPGTPLAGDIFVCVDEAVAQARRFRAAWQSELLRYIIHGALHLEGHDDLRPAARQRMKREENRRLRQLARGFNLSKLRRKTRV